MVTLLPDLFLTALLSSLLVVAGVASVLALPWRADELRATEGAVRGLASVARARAALALAGAEARPVPAEERAVPWSTRVAA